MAASRHQPALLGGLFIGVLSSLPIVNWLNCCCLWVVVGGVLTTYLKQQQQTDPLETADAVLAGLIAGAIGALLFWLVQATVLTSTAPILQERLREAFDQNPDMPQEWRDRFMSLMTGRAFIALMLAFTLPVYAVFSMLGGLLGLAFFRKKTPPPPPPAPVVV